MIRHLALVGWTAAQAVASCCARPAGLSRTTLPRMHTGPWCLGAGDADAMDVHLVGRVPEVVVAHRVERVGPVTVLRSYFGPATEDAVTFLWAARELTGADRKVVLSRHRRAQEGSAG